MEKGIPVGIFEQEIFIALYLDGKFNGFDVLRPVTSSMLSDLRDPDEYKEYCRDMWAEAARAGSTESSLAEFAQELIDEADCDNDEEAFPLKDDSGCQYLDDDCRKEADKFLYENDGIDVGTWEASGSFSPGRFRGKPFTKFDYVFDNDEARAEAEKYYATL